MIAWADFDSVFRTKAEYSLDQKQVDAIVRHRKEIGGTLFFDRIWSSIGLKQPQKSYPPKSNADLRSLWQKIAKAEVSDEKKQAVIFYVLKDCRQPANIDTAFATRVHLPLKYQILIMGLWELDHSQFSRALEHLTHPLLTPEFADDILLTLLTAPQCDTTLAMAYSLTVQPPMAKQETLEAYFKLLVDTNILEAVRFCRARETPVHRALFEELVHAVHEGQGSDAKAKRTAALIGLPLTHDEEQWFEEFLLRGSGAKTAASKDSILMRRLCTGRSITGVTALDRYHGHELNGVDWDNIRAIEKDAVS